MKNELTSELSAEGYWPAIAKEYFESRMYSKAIEICAKNLKNRPEIISGRMILALSLFFSEQINEAEEQFYRILQADPNNMVALKYIGDIKFRKGDEETACSYYNRVLKLDLFTEGLQCSLHDHSTRETKVLTLKRDGEPSAKSSERLRQIPFETETAADLLLYQGHTRMARQIYQNLIKINRSPRLVEKLEKIDAPVNEE